MGEYSQIFPGSEKILIIVANLYALRACVTFLLYL